MEVGQLAGVLHAAASVVHDPSGQGVLDFSGREAGGRAGHADTLLAHEVSRQRTGRVAGQMNERGHWEGEDTHNDPAPARGHEYWFRPQVIGSTEQEARQDPSAHRVEPKGQVTWVGHRAKATTHSPPGQRRFAVPEQAGTTVHCSELYTHDPSAHRTG